MFPQRIILTVEQFENIIEDAKAEGRAEVNGGCAATMFIFGLGLLVGVIAGLLRPLFG